MNIPSMCLFLALVELLVLAEMVELAMPVELVDLLSWYSL